MKKRSKLEKFTPFVVGACMLTFVACGNDDDDSNPPAQQQQTQQQQEGTYRVTLAPVNTNVASGVTGTGTFTISGDNIQAMMNVSGAPAAIHMQHVHLGTACATAANDTNGDGFIDAVEAGTATGNPFLPLDSDLVAQEAGGSYPSGATYTYDQSTSLQALQADLHLPDTDPNDTLVKLPANQDLNLEGKVVEIHGIPSSTTLPPTVAGVDGKSPQQSLPIACGVITRDNGTTTGTTTGTTGTGTTTGTTGTGTTTGTTGTGTTTGTTGTGTTTGTTGTGTTTGTTGTGTTTGTTGTGTTTGTTGTGTTTGTTGTGTTTGTMGASTTTGGTGTGMTTGTTTGM